MPFYHLARGLSQCKRSLFCAYVTPIDIDVPTRRMENAQEKASAKKKKG